MVFAVVEERSSLLGETFDYGCSLQQVVRRKLEYYQYRQAQVYIPSLDRGRAAAEPNLLALAISTERRPLYSYQMLLSSVRSE